MVSTPPLYISLIFLIFTVTSCGKILHENEDIVVELQYVSETANANAYHDDKVELEVRKNDGIQNYAWTDTCNSIKITIRNKSNGSPAYAQYRFRVDFGDGTVAPQNGLASNDIVHLYKTVREDGYKAELYLSKVNKPQDIITVKFTVMVQESYICLNSTFNHPPSIIRLNEGSTAADMQQVAQALTTMDATIIYRYTHVFKGFAIEYNAEIIDNISTHRHVEQISTDQETEQNIWHPSDYIQPLSLFNHNIAANGSGAHIYIIDTALYQHNQFKERIRGGVDFVVDNQGKPYFGDSAINNNNCYTHATHVTGIAAATEYGIASRAFIHPVRVLDCRGVSSIARVLAGLDWITKYAEKPAVVNMSLGARASRHLDDAVINSSKTGIFYAVSSGNKNNFMTDSCEQSPARVGKNNPVMTVGASTHQNKVAYLSLQGACVNIFALGYEVISAGTDSPDDFIKLSGSSMAVPYITGAAALYLQHHPHATPQEVHDYLIKHAARNELSNVAEKTVNLLYKQPWAMDTMNPMISLSSVTVTNDENRLIHVQGKVTDMHSGISHIRIFDGIRELTNEAGAKIHFPTKHDDRGPFNFSWQWNPDNVKPVRTLCFVVYDKANNISGIETEVPTEAQQLNKRKCAI